MSSGSPGVRIWITVAVALVLTIVPLPVPHTLDMFRPSFLLLTVLYWSIAAPWAGGIGLGWFAGLLLDIFKGPVLGEHALILSFMAYIFVREHQRIRSKPLLQQAMIVMFASGFYEVLLFLVDGFTKHPVTNPSRWAHIPLDFLIWFPATVILGYRERRA
jgi:rod shape-determining protein MreD